MRQQNDMIANLSAAARAQALANANNAKRTISTNHLTDKVMEQFVKSPVKFFKEVNPRKPQLSFDGSNYSEWENAIDRTLQHAFIRNSSFVNDEHDQFHTLDSLQNKAVAMLMRSTLDDALLSIVESVEITSSKQLFELLRSKCKRSGRRHKVILTKKILKFASEKSPASESWLARFCAIMSDIKRAKINVNELGGLILQALAKAPPGTDSKNFEYSISQPLDDMATIPTFEEVTTLIQSALSKVSKGATLSPGLIPSDVEMSINAINARRGNERYEPPHRRQPENPGSQQTDPSKFSVEKATFYRGKGQTVSLNERYDHNEKGSCFIPALRNPAYNTPAQPTQQGSQSNGRIRKIDIPDANDGTILLDSGSTINVSGKSRFFSITSRLKDPLTISLAISKYVAPINFIGSLTIPTPTGTMKINDVYFCEEIKGSILSTGRLAEDGWSFTHTGTDAKLLDPTGNSFDLTFLNHCWIIAIIDDQAMLKRISQKPHNELYKWHARLGHASEPVVRTFLRKYLPDVKLRSEPFFCVQCAKSKAIDTRGNGATSDIPWDKPMDLCMTDVAGPFTMDINGCRYILTFRDHASTYTYCALMATRHEVPDKVMAWVLHLKNTVGKTPSYIRCDNAAEYVGNLRERLDEVGTVLAPISPYHPEQNGEAERANRTFGDMARTMLHESKLPKIYWSYAYMTAAYIHNRIPNSRVSTSPLECLFGIKPSPNELYPFGARAIVHVPKDYRDKLDERGNECFLLGFPKAGSGWMFYSPKYKRMIQSTSAVFPEYQSLSVKEPLERAEVEGALEKQPDRSELDALVCQIKLVLGGEPTKEIAETELKAIADLPVNQEHMLPSTIKSALSGADSSSWRKAAEYKLKKFESLGVWEPVRPYKGLKALGARWVFTIKRMPDGSIDKFRARYVAKGFNQVMGTDCNETYAPTASLNTLRMLLSIAQTKNYPTASFDISSAYLYSPIEEEVYVQPPVEIVPEWKGKIMRLKKAMYGTRQAARCWWKFFSGKMMAFGLTASKLEPSLYYCKRGEEFVVIWLHVDDGFAMGSSPKVLDDLHAAIATEMEVKWLTKVEKLVGINISTSPDSIQLNQSLLTDQIIKDYPRTAYPRRSTLPEGALELNTDAAVETTAYRSTLGSLMYLCSGTRPDLSYSVNLLARYSANPSEAHWEVLDILVGYLKRTKDLGLVMKGGNGLLQLWSDANWGGEHERSTSGYLIKHCGNSIAWGARRQTVVALSTCAAEYIALSEGSQQLAQLHNLLIDIDHVMPQEIYCDNEAAILIAGDNASKKKTRYLSRAFYFINDFIRQYNIKIQWTDTHNQAADIFTKRLGPNLVEKALIQIGVTGTGHNRGRGFYGCPRPAGPLLFFTELRDRDRVADREPIAIAGHAIELSRSALYTT
ncbi:hypothetical protein PCASD_15704 [Puccinia coronata f. sp. avenae]|uniref:Integrase catalytic domain-containing protein n=1 Tax=Puccinia coronata f. sp. avenae TaxID=200324 RepID=A0A2N5UDG0_9BASI|nr:hypothetical protein PCASD_15704 [Puccinia coronata f. sp. avenae]